MDRRVLPPPTHGEIGHIPPVEYETNYYLTSTKNLGHNPKLRPLLNPEQFSALLPFFTDRLGHLRGPLIGRNLYEVATFSAADDIEGVVIS